MPKKKPKKLRIRVKKKQKINRGNNPVVLEAVASKALRFNRSALDATAKFTEKKKLLLLRAGVAGLMIIFFVAWIFSLKYQFKNKANSRAQNSFNWEQTKAELDQTMSQVKQGIKEIKQIQAAKQPNTLPREVRLTAEQLDLLKEKLIKETASGTKNKLLISN